MDNYRLILFVALAFIVTMIYQAWQQEHEQTPVPAGKSTERAQPKVSAGAQVPEAPKAKPTTATSPKTEEKAIRVMVTTDLLRAEINAHGGDIDALWLLQHPVSVDKPKVPFQLLKDGDDGTFVAQSGLIGYEDNFPTHNVDFAVDNTQYEMPAGADELRVPLKWQGPDGVQYTKLFVFHRGSYVVDVQFLVVNKSQKPWTGYAYEQLKRSYVARGGLFSLPTYTGGALYTPENKYHKETFDNMAEKPVAVQTRGGWVAMLQHYFVGAWIPPEDDDTEFYSRTLPNQLYVIGAKDKTATEIPPGQEGRVMVARLYAGPKEHTRLEKAAPGLELTVDYGWLTVISSPLFWLLSHIHRLIGNWGWSIIILTVLIKLAFYPLSAASYKSMAQMKKLQPKLQSLKERYGEDRQKLNQAMMELYKTEKINPLGGCLPIVVQIPVFLALYWVLLESVEMRQTPFILWIRDLSSPDPYFVLPVVMGLSMYVQQLLNPQPPDPMQRRIFMVMPIAFTVMFLFFPAGLVLYWVVNNMLSILQQWRITRVIAAKGG